MAERNFPAGFDQVICPSSTASTSEVDPFSYASRSPGSHSSTSHSRSRVLNRIAFAFPVFSTDRFCAVIPTSSASIFNRIFRRASITSTFTTSGIARPRSNDQLLFFPHLRRHLHKPRDRHNDQPIPHQTQPASRLLVAGVHNHVRHQRPPKVQDTPQHARDPPIANLSGRFRRKDLTAGVVVQQPMELIAAIEDDSPT